jgi:hypothetical protein
MKRRRRSHPNVVKRALVRLFRRRPCPPEWEQWREPPPDIGVREPRRPRPSGFGGAAVLDPPNELG